MVWLIVHLEVFNSTDMRLMDLVGSSSIIFCTLAMKFGSLVFLASSLDLVLRFKTAETSIVSFRPFLMSDTFENGIPKALEMVVLVTANWYSPTAY